MQKQQGVGFGESDDSTVSSITKYQVLVSSDAFGQKSAMVKQQVKQPIAANQEVSLKCVCNYVAV